MRVLAAAAVKPPARSADLATELDEGKVQGSLHEALVLLPEDGLGRCDMVGVAVVGTQGDGLAWPLQDRAQGLGQGFHHQRLHHAAAVAEDIAPKEWKPSDPWAQATAPWMVVSLTPFLR